MVEHKRRILHTSKVDVRWQLYTRTEDIMYGLRYSASIDSDIARYVKKNKRKKLVQVDTFTIQWIAERERLTAIVRSSSYLTLNERSAFIPYGLLGRFFFYKMILSLFFLNFILTHF